MNLPAHVTTARHVTARGTGGGDRFCVDRFDGIIQALENGSATAADLEYLRQALQERQWRRRYVQQAGLTSLLREQGRAIMMHRERLRWRQQLRVVAAAVLVLGLSLGGWGLWPQATVPAGSDSRPAVRASEGAVLFGPGGSQDLDQGRLQTKTYDGERHVIGRMDWKKPGPEWLMEASLPPGLYRLHADQMASMLVVIHKNGELRFALEVLRGEQREWLETEPIPVQAGLNLIEIPVRDLLAASGDSDLPLTGWRMRYPRSQPLCSEVRSLSLQEAGAGAVLGATLLKPLPPKQDK